MDSSPNYFETLEVMQAFWKCHLGMPVNSIKGLLISTNSIVSWRTLCRYLLWWLQKWSVWSGWKGDKELQGSCCYINNEHIGCDVRIQLYLECTYSTLPSIALESIWVKLVPEICLFHFAPAQIIAQLILKNWKSQF